MDEFVSYWNAGGRGLAAGEFPSVKHRAQLLRLSNGGFLKSRRASSLPPVFYRRLNYNEDGKVNAFFNR